MSRILMFTIDTEDVGATQKATVKLGDTVLGEWFTHTRHADTSLDVAERALTEALRPLIEESFKTEECAVWHGYNDKPEEWK